MAKYPQKPPIKIQMRGIHFESQLSHLEQSTKSNHPLNRTLVNPNAKFGLNLRTSLLLEILISVSGAGRQPLMHFLGSRIASSRHSTLQKNPMPCPGLMPQQPGLRGAHPGEKRSGGHSGDVNFLPSSLRSLRADDGHLGGHGIHLDRGAVLGDRRQCGGVAGSVRLPVHKRDVV